MLSEFVPPFLLLSLLPSLFPLLPSLPRRPSAMWHWPYCVNVGENTFKYLLNLLSRYGDVSCQPQAPPFTEKRCVFVCVFLLFVYSVLCIYWSMPVHVQYNTHTCTLWLSYMYMYVRLYIRVRAHVVFIDILYPLHNCQLIGTLGRLSTLSKVEKSIASMINPLFPGIHYNKSL